MRVLMINGSPRTHGNTALALDEMTRIFEDGGAEVTRLEVGGLTIPGCTGCGACRRLGKCFRDDIVNEAADLLKGSDAMIVGSPVYYSSPNGTLISFLDRLFFSNRADLTMKVGAGIVCARRGGCSASFDVLNKYFTISGMPVASSRYWNSIHGAAPGEAEQDVEGLMVMRTLARNTLFLMKSIELGKNSYGLPEREPGVGTNFIR